MKKQIEMHDWCNTFQFHPTKVFNPKTIDEIVGIVKQSAKEGRHIRVVGSLYSYTPLVATDDTVICLDECSGVITIDSETNEAHIFAGSKINFLEKYLYKAGYSFVTVGDADQQTLAGLVSTGSHGTGVDMHISSYYVTWIKFITAEGEVAECDMARDAELFKALQLSLGTLGIIVEMKIKVMPNYVVKIEKVKCDFKEAVESLSYDIFNNRDYEFLWFPYTDTVYQKTSWITDDNPKRITAGKIIEDYVLDNGMVLFLCVLSRRFPNLYRKYANKIVPNLLRSSCVNLKSGVAYASPQLVKNFEMEYAIPLQHATQALNELKALFLKNTTHVSLPVEVRYTKGDDIYMSPCYHQDSVWIAVHAYQQDPYEEIFKECEKIFLKNEGRPHWGKLHWLSAETLKSKYPEWDKFQWARAQVDPKGLFMNSYLKNLFLQ